MNSFKKPQEVIKLCQFDQTSTALIKLFREKQVCDFNLWYQALGEFQIQYGLRTAPPQAGKAMPKKVIYGERLILSPRNTLIMIRLTSRLDQKPLKG